MANEDTTQEVAESAEQEFTRELQSLSQSGVEETAEPTAGEKTEAQEPAAETTDAAKPEPVAPVEETKYPEVRPTNGDWKRHREETKALKARIAELEAQRAAPAAPASLTATPSVPVAPVVPAVLAVEAAPVVATRPQPAEPVKPQYEPESVLNLLARIDSGEFVEQTEGQAAKIRAEATTYLMENVSPVDLKNILLRANKGMYGSASPFISKLALEVMPASMATYQERQQEVQRAQAAEAERANAWNQVAQRFPKIQDTASPEFKDFQHSAKVIATAIPDIWKNPQAPAILADFHEMRTKAIAHEGIAQQLSAAQAEVAALKKRLGISERPQGPGRNVKPASAHESAEDMLKADFASLGITT